MIELDADQKTPLYEQLYAALADEIRTGQRAPGTPLPGRRTMAAQQGVSVNTVDAAYQMLAAEGLAEPRPPQRLLCAKRPTACCTAAPAAPLPPLHRRSRPPRRSRSTTCPPAAWTRRVPRRAAGDASRRSCSTSGPSFLQRGEMQGDAPLRTQIAEYLSVYRGVECTPEQIVVGAGIEYLLGAWRTCSATAWRPSRTPATSARGRSCRTAAFPARWWTLTARACPPTRWKKKRRKPLLSDAQSSLSDGGYDACDPPRPAAGLGSGPARAVHFGGRLRLGVSL